jgi:hypothetical protein
MLGDNAVGGIEHKILDTGSTATLLADGYIEVDEKSYQYPGTAATLVAGSPVSGLWFFRIDRVGGRSLRDVVDDYRTTMAVDADAELDDVAGEGDTGNELESEES